jgi:hypothetical protein
MGLVRAFVSVALGLTTTALGTLLPILRDNNMLRGSFGSYLLAGGAVGEFFPIVAIAIFLGSNGRFLGLMSLLAVAVIALVLSLIPRLGRGGRLAQILTEGQNATAQTTLRWTVVMLLLLLVIANTAGISIRPSAAAAVRTCVPFSNSAAASRCAKRDRAAERHHAAAKCGRFGWSWCALGAGLSGSRRWHRPACCPISLHSH